MGLNGHSIRLVSGFAMNMPTVRGVISTPRDEAYAQHKIILVMSPREV